MENLVEFIHHHNVLTIIVLTVAITYLRRFITNHVFFPLASKALEPNELFKLPKVSESLWFFMYYCITFSAEFYLLWTAPWTTDVRNYWDENFMAPPIEEFGLLFFYLLQLSNYISALIFVLFLSHARQKHKDKIVMTIHHVVTIILLSVSYMLNQHRIGTVVLIIHDLSDIFLEGSKTLNYFKFKKVVNIGFAIFAVAFFVTRLICLPLYVLHPIIFLYPNHLNYSLHHCYDAECKSSSNLAQLNIKSFWLFFLGSLQVLHIYWFALILRMVINALVTKRLDSDIRSDDENEKLDDEILSNNANKRDESKKDR